MLALVHVYAKYFSFTFPYKSVLFTPKVVNLIAVFLGTYAILFDDGYRKTVKPNCMKPMPEVRCVTPNVKCQIF